MFPYASVSPVEPRKDFIITNKPPSDAEFSVVKIKSIQEAEQIITAMTAKKDLKNVLPFKNQLNQAQQMYLRVSIGKLI